VFAEASSPPAFVIKAGELGALSYLPRTHPTPRRVEWINRGTNQKLRRTSVELLLRTLSQGAHSPSVRRLHDSAGLRAIFTNERERIRFASAFAAARARQEASNGRVASALFSNRDSVDRTIQALNGAGFPESDISVMWRAGPFLDDKYDWPAGHSRLNVAGAIAGSGVAAAMLGVALSAVPGVGVAASAGVLVASAFPAVATVSGIIGATGGAIAKMLTDHDVDGVAEYYDEEIRRGKVLVVVDTLGAPSRHREALEILIQHGGRLGPAHPIPPPFSSAETLHPDSQVT
jgi:hypothetical protein